MKIVKSILNALLTFLIVVVLIVSILIAVMSLTSQSSGISTFFGYTVQVIQSDSMKGGNDEYSGGNFEKGDVIIGKATGFDATRTYSVGDIVTYSDYLTGYEDLGKQLICHRIVDVAEYNGDTVYQTQGDNRSTNLSPDQESVDEYLHGSQIGAYFHTDNYDGIVIKKIGTALDFIKTQFGFFLCVLLPMIIFFIIVLIKFVISVVNYKNAKDEEKKEQSKKDNISAEQSTDGTIPQMDAEQYEQFKQFMAFQNAQKAAQAQSEQQSGQSEQPDQSADSDPSETDDTNS